jgi:hypothetical protein
VSTTPDLPPPTPAAGDGGTWYVCRIEGCMVRVANRAAHRAWHDTIRDVYTCATCKALVRQADQAAHDAWDASLVRLAQKVGITLSVGL